MLKNKEKYGKWKIVSYAGKNSSRVKIWNCQCECGTKRIVSSTRLLNGKSKSCGCNKIKARDIKGFKKGDWTIIESSGKKQYTNVLWICRCKCGFEKLVTYSSFKRDKNNKCNNCIINFRKNNIHISYFKRLKDGADKRELEFNISIDYLQDLFFKQNKRCALTDVDLVPFYRHDQTIEATASLDRIDSSKGYIEGNVQWIHKDINFMKMDISQDKFLYWCKLIVNKLQG